MDGEHDRGWNLADVFERVADVNPAAPALQHGDRTVSWADFDRRADGVGRALLDAGLSEQDKVAQYLHNCPEYLESVFACFKTGLAPVNTNHRYAADELVYLWDNSDAAAVVFHGTFTDTIDAVRDRVPRVRSWLWVDDGHGDRPDWATPYERAATSPGDGRARGPWGRTGEHLCLLYTGGTTGLPKGVMWPQDAMFGALDANNRRRMPPTQDLDAIADRVTGPGPRNLAAAPLMHGTGLFNAISNLMIGGSVTTMTQRRFDAVALLDAIESHRINSMSIVGDAFARPILEALDAEPGRWDVSSLRVIVSSGVMWSKATKQGLLAHNPRLIMVDSLGSSEAMGMATSTTTSDTAGDADTARFRLGPDTRVITEDGRDVTPGSGELGRVAMRGNTPIGYYRDPDKSAATFQSIDGIRYSIPGDWAEVLDDGTVLLRGRGSQCINTGGEKVYPEEVEEALKTHPTVADAAVVGLPDPRFGQAICALVQPTAGREIDEAQLIDHVKAHLARYKAPKRIVTVDTLGRAANGKLDYRALTDRALTDVAGTA